MQRTAKNLAPPIRPHQTQSNFEVWRCHVSVLNNTKITIQRTFANTITAKVAARAQATSCYEADLQTLPINCSAKVVHGPI